MNLIGRFFFILGLTTVLHSFVYSQEFSYSNSPLQFIINDIEKKTHYRFLYREALIADINTSFHTDKKKLLKSFSSAISPHQLDIKVDEQRHQVLIFKSRLPSLTKTINISGNIVDDETGERLPFATISWYEFGDLKGTTTNTSGSFNLKIPISEIAISLKASYIGYNTEYVYFDNQEVKSLEELTIRLTPKPFSGKEIVVQGINFYTPNDTVLHGLMEIGSFSPLGESNAVRSLQLLPAVSINTAINDGINIRGSTSDGLHVLLDGHTVYNQSHLFGLLDAMNSDALKSSGFYYDIIPAQYQAPLGGTLSLITRTGSLNDIKSSSGISNTAIKSTIEGPIIRGKSSWLLSGRMSYLGEVNWFNNAKLIEHGLNVNRRADLTVDPRLETSCEIFFRGFCDDPIILEIIKERLSLTEISILDTDASFYDLHSKLYFETKAGSQIMIGGYFGNDNSTVNYQIDEFENPTENKTLNNWKNTSLNGQLTKYIGNGFTSRSVLGYTNYSSNYFKQDFIFEDINETNSAVNLDSLNINPLNLRNEIIQFDLRQSVSKQLENGFLEIGISYSDFDVRYRELGLVVNSFESRRTSQLLDFFQQLDLETSTQLKISLGTRIHYFSNGRYLRMSPRLKAYYQIDNKRSFSLGFSRNYQFINSLQIYNINSNEFWILSNDEQPPSSVNYFSSGLYYNLSNNLYIQAEGYFKMYQNIRFHELNTDYTSISFQNNKAPWFYQNEGLSRGLEVLMKNRFKFITFTSTYTFSLTKFKNETKSNSDEYLLNNGEYFLADWDRRHQITNVSEIKLAKGFTLLSSWIFGTGIPSRVNKANERFSDARLPNYSRFDLTLNFKKYINKTKLETSFTLYNAFNRSNAWYSQLSQVNVPSYLSNNRKRNLYTHVYDLGIQPSFNIVLSF